MATFKDEDKKELGGYFTEGIHKVKIADVTSGETNGKEFFEFAVEGENGEEGSSRLWWSEKAMQYSFNTIKQIFVHNTIEKNRDQIRAKLDSVKDTDELFKMAQALIGKEAWYTVYKSDRTYQNADGETKYSYDRNITGYEPKPREKTLEEVASSAMGGGRAVTANDDIPFN